MSQLGQQVNTTELNKFLEHFFRRNNKLHEKWQRRTPIMIWGNHGLGKTHTVEEFPKKNNWKSFATGYIVKPRYKKIDFNT